MRILMHENAMDICFVVDRLQYKGPTKTIYKGGWYNLGYMGAPFLLYNNIKLQIPASSSQWRYLTPGQFYTKRSKPGVPSEERN